MMLLRDKLRQATRQAHEHLEARLGLDAPELTRERYADYLEGMLAFHRAVAADDRIGWLERDLAYLGRATDVADVPFEYRPPVHGEAEAIGVNYVLEGASLGGTVLYSTLNKRWGLAPETGGAFLFGYGPHTAARWKAIVQAINAAALDAAGETRCIAAAVDTFHSLDRLFELNGWEMAPA